MKWTADGRGTGVSASRNSQRLCRPTVLDEEVVEDEESVEDEEVVEDKESVEDEK